MAVDKGAIGDGHVLVLPIEHYPNSLGLPPSTHAEMDRYLAALQACYAAQVSGCTLTVRGGLHAVWWLACCVLMAWRCPATQYRRAVHPDCAGQLRCS